jgi:hypothetical protein
LTGASAVHRLLLFGPLAFVGFAAGILRVLAHRPGTPERRRRLLGALWVATLLVGAPLWLFLAVTLGL